MTKHVKVKGLAKKTGMSVDGHAAFFNDEIF